MHQSEAKFAKFSKCRSRMTTVTDKVKSNRAKQYVLWETNNEFLQVKQGCSQTPPLITFNAWTKVRLNPVLLAPTFTKTSLLVEIAKEIDSKFG